jgi:Tol biopolymer transport system component
MKLVVAGLRGGPVRTVTPPDRSIGYPSWSPDGRWLAAEERIGSRTNLVVVPVRRLRDPHPRQRLPAVFCL